MSPPLPYAEPCPLTARAAFTAPAQTRAFLDANTVG